MFARITGMIRVNDITIWVEQWYPTEAILAQCFNYLGNSHVINENESWFDTRISRSLQC